MTWIIYTRKSTDEPDNQRNSLEVQLKDCLEYADREKLPVASDTIECLMKDGIIKESHSAYKTKGLSFKNGMVEYSIERPKFMRMTDLLFSGKYDGCIVARWDRISRNKNDDLLIEELLDENKIQIQFVDVRYSEGSAGKLHRSMDQMVANHHSARTSENVKNTFRKKRQAGEYPHEAPLGYLDNGSANKTIDPERSPIIIRIFDLANQGWSINQLHKYALKQGLKTKLRRKHRTKEEILSLEEVDLPKLCRPVSRRTVGNILHNIFYTGKFIHKNKKTGTTEIIQGIHPPLISQELFSKVQLSLQNKYTSTFYHDKIMYTYRTLIHCPCGRVYSPALNRKKEIMYYYSRCKHACINQNKSISERELDDLVASILDKIYFSTEELEIIENEMEKAFQALSQKRNAEQNNLNEKRQTIHGDIDYLRENKITLLKTGVYTPDQYIEEENSLLNALQDLDKIQQAYTQTEYDMLDVVLAFSELNKLASQLYKMGTDSEKRQLFQMVFSELAICNKKITRIEAKPAFKLFLDRFDKLENIAHCSTFSKIVQSGDIQFPFSELSHWYSVISDVLEEYRKTLQQLNLAYKLPCSALVK